MTKINGMLAALCALGATGMIAFPADAAGSSDGDIRMQVPTPIIEAAARRELQKVRSLLAVELQACEAVDPTAGSCLDLLLFAAEPSNVGEDDPDREKNARRAMITSTRVLGPDHASLARVHNLLGLALSWRGELAAAEESFRAALAIDLRFRGASHPDTVSRMLNIGNMLNRQGRIAEAETWLRKAVAGYEVHFGDNSLRTIRAIRSLGSNLVDQLRTGEAVSLLRRAQSLSERNFGSDHTETRYLTFQLGMSLQMLGSYQDAEPLLRKHLASTRRAVGKWHRETVDAAGELAWNLELQSRLDAAEKLYRAAMQIGQQAYPGSHPDRYLGEWRLARFLIRNRRNLPQARVLLRTAARAALDRMEAHAEFGPAAQRELRGNRPVFHDAIEAAWQLTHSKQRR